MCSFSLYILYVRQYTITLLGHVPNAVAKFCILPGYLFITLHDIQNEAPLHGRFASYLYIMQSVVNLQSCFAIIRFVIAGFIHKMKVVSAGRDRGLCHHPGRRKQPASRFFSRTSFYCLLPSRFPDGND